MAEYSRADIEAAVQGGLISEDDAAMLLGESGDGMSWGELAGGAAGAALGGMAGAKLGGKTSRGLGNMTAGKEGGMGGMANTAAEALTAPRNVPGMGAPHSAGALGAGALGAGGGAYGGQMAGGAIDGGAGGGGGLSEADRNAATQALMDPNTPPDVKRQIMDILDSAGGMPPGAGMVAGAGLGAGLGAGGMRMAANKFAPDMGNSTATRLANSPAGQAGMGVMGAGGGAMLGDFAQAAMGPDPYADPLAGQQ